jgi:hypothetical protein
MPLVLLALAVALILGSCFLTSASTSTGLGKAANDRLRARMIAETGLSVALSYVEKDVNWRSNRANGVWIPSQSFAGGTFTVSGEDGETINPDGTVAGDGSLTDDRSDPVVITSVGVYNGVRHLVRAVRYPPKASGITVNERVEVKGSSVFDSYNPDLGTYASSTPGTTALAKSNGALRTSYIKLRNNAKVNGNVYFGPGGSLARTVQQDTTAVVTGTIGPLPAAVVMPSVTEPAWPVMPTGITRAYSSGINVVSADLWLDRLDLTGTATLRALGNVNLYVSGPTTVTDDAKIEVGYPMAMGAAVSGTINLSGGPVDSYDSSKGPYGGTNVGSNAVLGTNSTAPAAITASAPVSGDAYSGVGSIPATSIVGTVTGTKTALTAPLTIPAPAPMPTNVPPSSGALSITNGYVLSTDMQVSSVSISGGSTLSVVGQRILRVNGDFSVSGGATIDIPSGASLSIYVSGTISISGNSSVYNTGTSPPRLIFYSTGSNPVTLSGSSSFYALIDAPNSAVSLGGGATFYGAIMSASLSTGGGAVIHNDRNPALVDTDPRMAATWSTGSKLTVYTNDAFVIQSRAKVNYGPKDTSICILNHLGPLPLQVKDTALVYARAVVPDMRMEVTGAAQWTGRIRARDLLVGGTAGVTASASGGAADPAISVDETVEIKDSAVLSASSGTGSALLSSNGATDYTIDVTDTASYQGDGYSSPGGTPANEIHKANTATFTGAKAALAQSVLVNALPLPPPRSVVSDHTIAGSATETITGDAYYASFVIRDDATLQVNGDARLILSADFRAAKNAKIVLSPGARLTVHCPGRIYFTGNVRVNPDGQPRCLTFNCPNAPEVEIRGTSKVTATLLAPLAQLRLSDTGELFGAFTGKRAKIDASAKFHCARNLTGPVNWLEQQQ